MTAPNHNWRQFKNVLMQIFTFVCAVIVVTPLLLIYYHLARFGLGSINWAFFTKLPKAVGELGGGMANAIVGSLILLAQAVVVGVPVGVLGGVYLSEYGGTKFNWWVRFTADIINGVPSITWGVVVWALMVVPMHTFSALAGGVVLGLMMIPLVMRTTEEVLQLVPGGYREAALALGISRWRTIVQIVVRTALKGIVTGVLVALARIAGETAPLLFTAFGNLGWAHSLKEPIDSIPVLIFNYAISPYEDWHRQAWAGALVLLLFMLIINVGVRFVTRDRFQKTTMNPTMTPEEEIISQIHRESKVERPEPLPAVPVATPAPEIPTVSASVALTVKNLSVFFGKNSAVKNVSLNVAAKAVTAIIGPSGCGKSTFLRALNRMHELNPEARMEGEIRLFGEDIYSRNVEPVVVRRRIGMVFQKSNPFPTMSIVENVTVGLRLNGVHNRKLLAGHTEKSLRMAALWDEVKDRLHAPAISLSGGQQQRLCIARALAVEPEVLLMDEPASALDPLATSKIEDLIVQLKKDYTIVIVTHNMQQAARASDYTAFFYLGELVEFGPTAKIFTNPSQKRTEDYVTGRFG